MLLNLRFFCFVERTTSLLSHSVCFSERTCLTGVRAKQGGVRPFKFLKKLTREHEDILVVLVWVTHGTEGVIVFQTALKSNRGGVHFQECSREPSVCRCVCVR